MDLAPSGLTTIMDRLRRIVSEGDVDIRTQYIVEGLFSLRKANFEGCIESGRVGGVRGGREMSEGGVVEGLLGF